MASIDNAKFWLCHYYDNDLDDCKNSTLLDLSCDQTNRYIISTFTAACPEALVDIRAGNWLPSLRQPLCSAIVRQLASTDDDSSTLNASDVSQTFALAIAALQAFVQENFVGPRLSNDELPRHIADGDADAVEALAKLLHIDGEEANSNVSRPELLLVAQRLLVRLLSSPTNVDGSTVDIRLVRWWYLRYLYVHQQLLDEHTDSLYAAFVLHSDEMLKPEAFDGAYDDVTATLLRLEIAQGYLAYRRAWLAEPLFTAARSRLGVELLVQGFLGKRTKWQQQALPQLALRVNRTEADEPVPECQAEHRSSVTHASSVLPTLLQLDDEVRLERITFESDEDNRTLSLTAVEQQLVLGVL